MIDSIAPQLTENDYITLLWDAPPIELDVKSECRVINFYNQEPLGYWGHGSRNHWSKWYFGDYIMNADDDDVYLPDAMEHIRAKCTEKKLYIFKMIYGDTLFWRTPVIEMANIGTPCGVYPNRIALPEWGLFYGGDFQFYDQLSKTLPVEFCDNIIYRVKGE